MYEMRLDPERRRLYTRLWGFWEQSTYDAYAKDAAKFLTQLGKLPAPTTSLIDASSSTVQSTDMAAKLAESGQTLSHLLPTRSATVVPNMLIKLQAQRLAIPSSSGAEHAIFTSSHEAEAWLDELK